MSDEFKLEKILIRFHESMIKEKHDGKKVVLLVMAVNDIRLHYGELSDILSEQPNTEVKQIQ